MDPAQPSDLPSPCAIRKRLQILARTAEQLLRSEDPRGLLESLYGDLTAELGVEVYVHYRAEEDGRGLRLEAIGGVPDELTGSLARLNLGQAVCGTAALEGRRFIVEDVLQSTDPRTAHLQRLGVTAYVCHPLIARGRLVGTLSFGTRHRTAFDAETLAIVQAVSDQVAIAIARKEAEDEREARIASERAARAEAERASRLKDDFLATLSHELRTPLNAILGWSQILRRSRRGPEDIEKGLEIIERNTRLQVQLISDLLDISRVVSGKIRLDLAAVDLRATLKAAVDTLRPTAEAKGVHLEEALEPVTSRGDPARLQQVAWNLLSNAIKFTPRGGHIHVTLARAGERAVFRVRDTGQGISPDFLPCIFERFRQADPSAARRHGGLGIGLAVVHHIVELHGGRVSASSDGEGRGAIFVVELPLEEARARSGEAADAWPEEASEAQLQGLRVLVVDDAADARGYVQRILEEREVEVRSASSVSEALAAVAELAPDILVSDIGMPDEDGYALIRQIRGHHEDGIRDLPAVALTAFARAEDRARALAAGYQLHVSKPLEPAELLAALARLAGPARARRHLRDVSTVRS